MAVPKKKHSRSRSGRKAAHHAIKAPSISTCNQCNGPRLPHRVCPSCGHYGDREVIRQSSADQG